MLTITLFLLCQGSFIKESHEVYAQVINQEQHQYVSMEKNQDLEVIDKSNSIAKEKNAVDNRIATDKEEKSIKAVTENNQNGKTQENERDIMEEALQLLDESRIYWEKGDLENALDMLDQAYALILDTDGDPDIARQKDDLRLLISKKILAIYTSMQTATSGSRSEIPHILNADVEKEIRQFQTVERDFFIQSYKRSGFYRPIILRELKKAGLPEELSWLPLVESGFKTYALSKARALGLWQFIPSTGYKYGLNRDEWIDERLDVEKSTRAAIDYLRELHGMFGDWLTVLAGYNCGEGRVLRLISRQHINYFDRFWDLYKQLPNETARYVPRFLATLLIIKDPKKYNMDLEENLDQPYSYEIVKTTKSMKLQDVASHIGVDEELLNTLNSELRQKITPAKEYNLKVPRDTAKILVKVMEEIPKCEKPHEVLVKHRVKRGETLVSIARKYKISVRAIISANGTSGIKRVRMGQQLIIPLGDRAYSRLKQRYESYDNKEETNNDIIKYKVKKGDTLASIAKRFGTSVHMVTKMNNMHRATIKTGQIIKISSAGNTPDKNVKRKEKTKEGSNTDDKQKYSTVNSSYIIKKGDSLAKIAKKSGINLDTLMQMNKLSKEDKIQPGQMITIR